MSTATVVEAPPPAKGKKKLIIIVGAAVLVLVLAVAGVAALMLMKKKATDVEGDDGAPAHAEVKRDAHAVPTFVPLDPFTVNLADRDAERYAQIGITLEIGDAHMADQIKTFMPAIRNNILLAIADRTAAELMGREGKARLAEKIRSETSRALGFEVEDDEAPAPAATDEDAEDPHAAPAKGKKKAKKKSPVAAPIKAVHFSNIIIQ